MTLMATERVPYDAEHVIHRDFGHAVQVCWTADPDLADKLKTCDNDAFDGLFLNPSLDIEAVASMRRVNKRAGGGYSGWVITDNSGSEHPIATRKREAMKVLREAVADYFTR